MPAQPARYLNDDRHERRHPHPRAWTKPPFVTVAVSVNGLAKDHNLRRKPATYKQIRKKHHRHQGQYPLDRRQPAHATARRPRPVRLLLERSPRGQQNLDRRLHSPTRRSQPRNLPPASRISLAGQNPRALPPLPQTPRPRRHGQSLPRPADPDCAQRGCSYVSRTPLDWRR